MSGNNVYRLAKPAKKGIVNLLFSRFSIVVILFLLQVLMVLTLFVWLRTYLTIFSILTRLFTVGMVVYLFCNSMDASSKLTWFLLLSIVPVVAAIFLFYVQEDRKMGKTQSRILAEINGTKNAILQSDEVISELKEDKSGIVSLSRYLNRSGCYNIYNNTEVKFFPIGEAKFQAMLEELKKAEKFIFMEYFIIEEGYMWGEILKVLSEKAKEGVEIRVMYDGMCEMALLPHNYPELLSEIGIKAKPFVPFKAFVSSVYNNRDHRKILVIDGKVAFNGGVNLADEYINHIERFGHWKDTAVMLKGDAVKSFTLMFLQMWNSTENEDTEYDRYISVDYSVPENSNGFVMPYGDCPLDSEKAGELVYMDILNRAEKYVHIMTPYLILDGELETAIKFAAERGVDVRLILPGIPDKKLAYALAKSHYPSLLKSGVKIYEYDPGFVHAKVFVSDDCKAVIGTINLDYRSLYHHFECATFMYKTDCISDIETDYNETLKKCSEVTVETLQKEKLFYKVVGPLIKFLAPLM